jgi:hypothetical protein
MSNEINKELEDPPVLDTSTEQPDKEYVGYGHPPTKTRFQKGHPYHPPRSVAGKGRRLKKAMEAALNELIPVQGDGGIEYLSLPVVLVARLRDRALHDEKGTAPFKILFDLFEKYDTEDEAEGSSFVDPEAAQRIKDNFAARVRAEALENEDGGK